MSQNVSWSQPQSRTPVDKNLRTACSAARCCALSTSRSAASAATAPLTAAELSVGWLSPAGRSASGTPSLRRMRLLRSAASRRFCPTARTCGQTAVSFYALRDVAAARPFTLASCVTGGFLPTCSRRRSVAAAGAVRPPTLKSFLRPEAISLAVTRQETHILQCLATPRKLPWRAGCARDTWLIMLA